jgi:hypothetical protein
VQLREDRQVLDLGDEPAADDPDPQPIPHPSLPIGLGARSARPVP